MMETSEGALEEISAVHSGLHGGQALPLSVPRFAYLYNGMNRTWTVC